MSQEMTQSYRHKVGTITQGEDLIAALKILDWICRQVARPIVLTAGLARDISEMKERDPSNALSALEKAGVLVVVHVFYDPETGEEYQIPSDEWAEAVLNGSLIHPESGEEIPDYNKHCYPLHQLHSEFVLPLSKGLGDEKEKLAAELISRGGKRIGASITINLLDFNAEGLFPRP